MPETATQHGKLNEQERAEANRNHGEREDQPADAFLEPEQRKYPVKVKRDGAWHYDRDLLLAAAREARMHGHEELAERADTIRAREFGGADDAEFSEGDHPRDEHGRFSASPEGAAAGVSYHETEAQKHNSSGTPAGANLGRAHASIASSYRGMAGHYERGSPEGAARLHEGLKSKLKDLRKLEGNGGKVKSKVERSAAPLTKNDISRVLTRAAERSANGASAAQIEHLSSLIQKSPNAQNEYSDFLLDTTHGLSRSEASALIEQFKRGSDDIALDSKSVRHFDEDGRLHVDTTPISKATVNEYFGHEIPDAEKLGLDPQRKYRLLRDPEELKKAAETFNNLPLMIKHVRQSADDPQKDKVVGSLGTDAAFDHPHLKNSLVVWDKDAIDGIQNNRRRQLSSSYRYDADMTPGTFEGQSYDGVMRNIRGNHVALVEEGRAGPDVLVEDSLPETMKECTMKVSRRAIVAHGALAGWLAPKLASDEKLPDLKAVLLGTTAKNWQQAKPQIAHRLNTAMAGKKLAKDASLNDVHGFLDSLDREGQDNMEPDEMEVVDRRGRDAEPDGARARDAEPDLEKVFQFLDGKIDGDLMEGLRKLMGADRARDAEPESEEDMEKRHEREREEAKDRRARDGRRARDETPEEREKREREDKERRERERAEDKRANDQAIQDALAVERQRQADIREAERAARPYVGEIVMAQDSAEAVYRLALGTLGVKHDGIHPSALRAVLEAQPKPGSARPRMAHDAAAAKSFAEQFPAALRIRAV